MKAAAVERKEERRWGRQKVGNNYGAREERGRQKGRKGCTSVRLHTDDDVGGQGPLVPGCPGPGPPGLHTHCTVTLTSVQALQLLAPFIAVFMPTPCYFQTCGCYLQNCVQLKILCLLSHTLCVIWKKNPNKNNNCAQQAQILTHSLTKSDIRNSCLKS